MNRATKRMNTAGQRNFAMLPSVSVPRSTFDRSAGLKTTLDAGLLVPIFCDEALPGDTIAMSPSFFARLATPLHPIMDALKLDVFFFSVPIRLIWDNWQKFNGEQDNPADSTDFLVPTVGPGVIGQGVGSLWDYMGLPIHTASEPDVCAFWHRAYNLIWKEWFRDENLQDSVPCHKDDGPDPAADYVLLRRGKRKDYLTSCLPWPQKGDAVSLPLGTTAPIESTGQLHMLETGGTANLGLKTDAGGTKVELDVAGTGALALEYESGLQANLSTATAATINQLREAFQIQKLYERDARGGTRYTEVIQAHFGVTSPDARLQRPEVLSTGSFAINVTPVPQTSETGTTAQGNLAAYGLGGGATGGFVQSFTEHCVILGLVCARADLNYQQNVPRMFSRNSRWDFFWPALSHLGEQAVLNKEIYYTDADSLNDNVWGYQERWAEYRYKPSQLTGKMRSDFGAHTTSLDTWHLAQDFGVTRPVLDATFIEENPPVDRVIAVTSEPHFLLDAYFQFHHTRPIPTYSVPGLIDHF